LNFLDIHGSGPAESSYYTRILGPQPQDLLGATRPPRFQTRRPLGQELGPTGSGAGSHWVQELGPTGSRSWGPLGPGAGAHWVQELGPTGSRSWGPLGPGAGAHWIQELGPTGSRSWGPLGPGAGAHWVQELGPTGSRSWDPLGQELGPTGAEASWGQTTSFLSWGHYLGSTVEPGLECDSVIHTSPPPGCPRAPHSSWPRASRSVTMPRCWWQSRPAQWAERRRKTQRNR